MKSNYLKFFELLILYLTKVNPVITDINDFINYVEQEKGSSTLESIDFAFY